MAVDVAKFQKQDSDPLGRLAQLTGIGVSIAGLGAKAAGNGLADAQANADANASEANAQDAVQGASKSMDNFGNQPSQSSAMGRRFNILKLGGY